MTLQDIPTNLAHVRAAVRKACASAGRDPSSVQLLAASKTVSPERVVEAVLAGQLLFGENKAQELRDKQAAVDALLQARGVAVRPEWHFIGHLQTNKVRLVADRVAMVHTVDRAAIASALAARRRSGGALPPLPVLVEVNLAGEPTKAGVPPDGVLALCHEVSRVEGLALDGLMAVPPAALNPRDSARWFELLAALAQAGRREGLPLRQLSMGMTHDFRAAIAAGSTMIRLGTAIFGPRPQV